MFLPTFPQLGRGHPSISTWVRCPVKSVLSYRGTIKDAAPLSVSPSRRIPDSGLGREINCFLGDQCSSSGHCSYPSAAEPVSPWGSANSVFQSKLLLCIGTVSPVLAFLISQHQGFPISHSEPTFIGWRLCRPSSHTLQVFSHLIFTMTLGGHYYSFHFTVERTN